MTAHSLSAWVAAFFLASCAFSHTVALRLFLLVLGAALVTWAALKNPRELDLLPPIWLAFALWAGWAALSMAWSIDTDRSQKEFRNEFVYTALALWVCYVAAQAPGAMRRIAWVLAAAVIGACGVALYSFTRGLEAYALGVHGGPGDHSTMLVLLMACALGMWWYAVRTGRRRMVAGSIAFAALLAISAYTTLNRNVWLAFAAELLLMLGFMFFTWGRAWSARRKVAIILVVALVPAAATGMTWLVHSERTANGAPPTLEKDARAAIWPEVLELIQERPGTGYGVGRGMLRDTLRKETNDRLAWHAHNLFLDTLLQTGIPGLALLVLLLAALLLQAWRFARQPDVVTAACGITLAGIVVGMIVRNMTDMLWIRQNALLFWGLTGVLLGCARSRTVARPG